MDFNSEKNKKVERENNDILSEIGSYALIQSELETGVFTIYDVKNQSFILAETDHEVLVRLMIKKGVKIVKDINEVKDPNFVRYMLKWDEEKKEFVKIKAPTGK